MLRKLRSGQRGQSLVEFALVAPVLLLFVAVGADLARMFFIGVDLTNSAREGALYSTQHAGDVGQTQAALESQVTTVMTGEEQVGSTPLKCPTSGETIAFAYSPSGNIPPAAGTTTTVTISVTCTVSPLIALRPLPAQFTLKTTVQGLTVGPAQ